VTNFARSGFNDRVQSAVVHDGRWEICVDADFGGSCGVLAPGAYPSSARTRARQFRASVDAREPTIVPTTAAAARPEAP